MADELLHEFNRLGKAKLESMQKLIDYIGDFDTSRQALTKASAALAEEPDCEVLHSEVLRLQEDLSRTYAERKQEQQKYRELNAKFVQVRQDFLEEPFIQLKKVDSQNPGKQQHLHFDFHSSAHHPHILDSLTVVRSDCGASGLYRYIFSHFLPYAVHVYKNLS